tara:strand:+ start:1291 stop:3816 length:2526 start_codon:yes stop_codon:yes gene_type:complete
MNTETFNVMSLRGMDERWITSPSDASLIIDMTWSDRDCWRDSGGFQQVWPPTEYSVPEKTEDEDEDENENPVAVQSNLGYGSPSGSDSSDSSSLEINPEFEGKIHYPIHSLHWFSQHNGARQWLLWEQQKTFTPPRSGSTLDLYVFDGTLVKGEEIKTVAPWRKLEKWAQDLDDTIGSFPKTLDVDDRIPVGVGVKTQSETWAGNIYFVNGYNEPLVFNGEICERAGFSTIPPVPSAKPPSWFSSNMMIIAIGSLSGTAKYSRWHEFPYSGMGPRGYAAFGAGDYDKEKAGSPYGTYSTAWAAFRTKEQSDTRRVGWQYRVTYLNERGQESQPSEPSNIAMYDNGVCGSTQHGKAIISVDLPIGPSECVARRVYRTRQLYNSSSDLAEKGFGVKYYYLAEIQDNMTTSWVDHHPDTHLGSELDSSSLGNFPPGTKLLATFKNTMFAAGSNDNTIEYSAALFPEVYPQEHVIHVGDEDGGEITGMRATKNALIVFKTRGIYLIKGNPSEGFFAHTLNKDVGCVAPNSLTELPGLGLAFLSEKGVMLIEGALENTGTPTSVVDLSATIPDQIERITKAAAVMACGALYLKDKEYLLSVPMDGRSQNQRILVYHYEIGSWSFRDYIPMGCAVTTRDHRGYLYFGSHLGLPEDYTSVTDINTMIGAFGEKKDTESTGLCVYSRGFAYKGGLSDGIRPTYETSNIPFGNYFATVQPAHVMVYAVGMGNEYLKMNYEINRSGSFVRSGNQEVAQQDPNNRLPVYGEAEWSVDKWAKHRPTVLRYDVSTTSKGPTREFKISLQSETDSRFGKSSERNRVQIIGFDIEAKVGEQKRIKSLNEALSPDRR